MLTVHPQYITDTAGRKVSVILPVKEFDAVMEKLEAFDDIRLYGEAIIES